MSAWGFAVFVLILMVIAWMAMGGLNDISNFIEDIIGFLGGTTDGR